MKRVINLMISRCFSQSDATNVAPENRTMDEPWLNLNHGRTILQEGSDQLREMAEIENRAVIILISHYMNHTIYTTAAKLTI